MTMKSFKPKMIAWLLLASLNLIASSCASSMRLKKESQKRVTTIAFNAQRISDADAAVACYDMLEATEKRLADTSSAYRNYREITVPKLNQQAKKKGLWSGAGAATALWLTILLVLK